MTAGPREMTLLFSMFLTTKHRGIGPRVNHLPTQRPTAYPLPVNTTLHMRIGELDTFTLAFDVVMKVSQMSQTIC